MPITNNNYFFAQVCQGIRCALVGGIIGPSMVSPAQTSKLVLLKTTSCSATPILLNHSAQPPPKPCPNLARSNLYPAQPRQSPAQTMPPCSAQTLPCSNKPCSNLTPLKPRPAQPCPAQPSLPHAHTLLKPHPTQALPKCRPAQSHTLLNHAHPLLYLTNSRSAKPCPKPYSTPPCSNKPWST